MSITPDVQQIFDLVRELPISNEAADTLVDAVDDLVLLALDEGEATGHQWGYDEGYEEGYDAGYRDGEFDGREDCE